MDIQWRLVETAAGLFSLQLEARGFSFAQFMFAASDNELDPATVLLHFEADTLAYDDVFIILRDPQVPIVGSVAASAFRRQLHGVERLLRFMQIVRISPRMRLAQYAYAESNEEAERIRRMMTDSIFFRGREHPDD